jgi:hypothetical protein
MVDKWRRGETCEALGEEDLVDRTGKSKLEWHWLEGEVYATWYRK